MIWDSMKLFLKISKPYVVIKTSTAIKINHTMKIKHYDVTLIVYFYNLWSFCAGEHFHVVAGPPLGVNKRKIVAVSRKREILMGKVEILAGFTTPCFICPIYSHKQSTTVRCYRGIFCGGDKKRMKCSTIEFQTRNR